jgi:hypothetical protein
MRPFLIAIIIALSASQAHAWGQNGHRITGAIAEPLLSRKAKTQIFAIIGNESLAEASTWADEMRSSPEPFWQTTSVPWHWVTVPTGKTYGEVGAPHEGDALTALNQFEATLKNPSATKQEKQLALRFIVHIIGDLHQPLHVGNGADRGGNDRKVTFGREETNLHSVWDTTLIEREQLSFTEATAFLARKITPQMVRDNSQTDPLVWIAESASIRDGVYPTEDRLSYGYAFKHQETVDNRLTQAGIRMAAYFNRLFK